MGVLYLTEFDDVIVNDAPGCGGGTHSTVFPAPRVII